jgi:hypothetical protein
VKDKMASHVLLYKKERFGKIVFELQLEMNVAKHTLTTLINIYFLLYPGVADAGATSLCRLGLLFLCFN